MKRLVFIFLLIKRRLATFAKAGHVEISGFKSKMEIIKDFVSRFYLKLQRNYQGDHSMVMYDG